METNVSPAVVAMETSVEKEPGSVCHQGMSGCVQERDDPDMRHSDRAGSAPGQVCLGSAAPARNRKSRHRSGYILVSS